MLDQILLPTNPGWWLMFEVSKRDIEIISLEILQLYTYPNVSCMVPNEIIKHRVVLFYHSVH